MADDDVWTQVLPLWNRLEDDRDVDFYLGLAARLGFSGTPARPTAELGVGYGRLAARLRPRYGVDSSPGALAACAEAAPDTVGVLASVEDYALPEPAVFTYAPQNLASLIPDGVLAGMLRTACRGTAPGGWLALDAAVPDPDRLRARDGVQRVQGEVDGARLLTRQEGAGPVVEMHHSIERAGRRVDYPPVVVRYRSPSWLRAQIEAAGWEVAKSWGGFDGSPLAAGSSAQLWLARRP